MTLLVERASRKPQLEDETLASSALSLVDSLLDVFAADVLVSTAQVVPPGRRRMFSAG
jgi:hypothetical protein